MALILLADDDRVTREMMRVRLESAGHEVVCAGDGREALEQLGRLRPQLIVLDMMMPELDGPEVLRVIKQDAVLSPIPVMIVSARAQEDDVLSALEAGADDYVTKPISLRELLARVDHILAQGPEPFRIAVQGPEGPVSLGEVVESSPDALSVRFHSDSAPPLAIGDPARLSLTSASLARAIELETRTISRSEAEPHRIYAFRIERSSPQDRENAEAFLDLLSGRVHQRVRFDGAEAVPVTLLTADGGAPHEWSGVLADLSAGGARVLIKAGVEREMRRVDFCELRLVLPGDDAPLTLAGSIRHRIVCDQGVAYGIRFDPVRSTDFVEQQERISGFVHSLES